METGRIDNWTRIILAIAAIGIPIIVALVANEATYLQNQINDLRERVRIEEERRRADDQRALDHWIEDQRRLMELERRYKNQ